MNDLFVFAAHNTVAAIVLAVFVYGLTRVWRNPPVAHALWLLVLLKLVAPPILRIDGSALRVLESMNANTGIIARDSHVEGPKRKNDRRFVNRLSARTTAPGSAGSIREYNFAAGTRAYWSRGRPALLWFWLGGAAMCGLVAVTRMVRFERLLRNTLPASERVRRIMPEIAGKLGLQGVPEVRYVECVEVPFVWCAGRRPTIVLPMGLLSQLDDEGVALILAHELAHVRRRDHWVRAVELIVSTIYWWNPLVWLIRRQLHQAEELCCDAWVRSAFPDRTKRYAEVLLKTAESLSGSQVRARLLPASPFLRSFSLKARIEMILDGRFAPYVSTRLTFVIALLALLVLPTSVQIGKKQARADSTDEAAATPAQKPDTVTTSEFPHVVRFEQGATRFLDGDKITILEIRGTAETFTPGNIYWIKGKYTLASRDRAMLAAFTTAMDAENGTGPYLKVQTTVANRGDGTFTLFLPMSCRGWPHVSFYPADNGESFGGNYIGTGDSVLKRWWGTNEKH
jgi:beta-lactamase regulating signal transducer with metallopeptidase domain